MSLHILISLFHFSLARKVNLGGNLALYEAHSLRAILFNVLLVRVGVTTIATVRIRGVAIRLDLVGGSAAEALRASSKLEDFSLRTMEAID